MHRTQIYLPDDAYHALREVSKQQRVTLAEVIRRAVDDYLARLPRQSFREALESSAGAWSERSESSEELVRALRQEWSQRDVRHRHQHSD